MKQVVAGCVLGAAFVGCGKDDGSAARRIAFVERLQHQPGRVAEAPPPGTEVVLLSVGVVNGELRVQPTPIPVGGSLRMERALARRRSDPPAFWLLLVAGEGDGLDYWSPLDPSPRIRANLPTDTEERPHVDGLVAVPEMYVALRVPFYPKGRLYFYAADGTPAGSYRFGAAAAQPLIRLDRQR